MNSPEPINFQRERQNRRPGVVNAVTKQTYFPASPPLPPEPKPSPTPKQQPHCSCCLWVQERVNILLSFEREVLLCDGCIAICNEIFNEDGVTTDAVPRPSKKEDVHSGSYKRISYSCSFCNKEQKAVIRLIAMLNNIYICNGCVGRCNIAIAEVISNTPTEAEHDGEKK